MRFTSPCHFHILYFFFFKKREGKNGKRHLCPLNTTILPLFFQIFLTVKMVHEATKWKPKVLMKEVQCSNNHTCILQQSSFSWKSFFYKKGIRKGIYLRGTGCWGRKWCDSYVDVDKTWPTCFFLLSQTYRKLSFVIFLVTSLTFYIMKAFRYFHHFCIRSGMNTYYIF